MNEFRNVAADQKREVGQHLNKLKEVAQNKINELKASFENSQAVNDDIDLTRTAYPIELGTRPSAFNRQERDLRHLRPLGLQHRRRAGD